MPRWGWCCHGGAQRPHPHGFCDNDLCLISALLGMTSPWQSSTPSSLWECRCWRLAEGTCRGSPSWWWWCTHWLPLATAPATSISFRLPQLGLTSGQWRYLSSVLVTLCVGPVCVPRYPACHSCCGQGRCCNMSLCCVWFRDGGVLCPVVWWESALLCCVWGWRWVALCHCVVCSRGAVLCHCVAYGLGLVGVGGVVLCSSVVWWEIALFCCLVGDGGDLYYICVLCSKGALLCHYMWGGGGGGIMSCCVKGNWSIVFLFFGSGEGWGVYFVGMGWGY